VKPNPKFLRQPHDFWANVRTIAQQVGYTVRRAGQIKVPSVAEISAAYQKLSLKTDHLFDDDGKLTPSGKTLIDYLQYRADILNDVVRPNLMDVKQAKSLYKEIRAKGCPKCPLPMNKQKGKKRAPAYLTAIVNMLVASATAGEDCDFDPRGLTTFTRKGAPVRTLARRIDGAFPGIVNPVAVWEIKEYYYTTSFGSRVADGVYESLLDGMELKELREQEGIDVKHYLILDARYTWWECGRSYLCRIVDMLHMGYVDEVLVGREVVNRLPELAKEWIRLAKKWA
jgi:hypothetical protein